MKKLILFVTILLLCSTKIYAINEIEKNILVKTTKSWNGDTLPLYSKGQPEITIIRIKIQPGEKLPWHYHPFANAGVLISGELKVVTKKGEVLYLTAGKSIVETVNTLHYGINESKEVADLIIVYSGIEDKSVTIIENK